MFIFADLSLPQTLDGWSELDDENPVHRAVSSHSVDADTYLSEAAPSSTYNSSDSGTLSDGIGQQSRILLRFPMNFTQSDTVHEANIELECTTEILGSPELKVYVAEMEEFWNGSFASWNVYENNQLWDLAGADGETDRGAWEPSVSLIGNGTLTLNVTSLAQHAARSNAPYLSVILASYGAEYACAMSESNRCSRSTHAEHRRNHRYGGFSRCDRLHRFARPRRGAVDGGRLLAQAGHHTCPFVRHEQRNRR